MPGTVRLVDRARRRPDRAVGRRRHHHAGVVADVVVAGGRATRRPRQVETAAVGGDRGKRARAERRVGGALIVGDERRDLHRRRERRPEVGGAREHDGVGERAFVPELTPGDVDRPAQWIDGQGGALRDAVRGRHGLADGARNRRLVEDVHRAVTVGVGPGVEPDVAAQFAVARLGGSDVQRVHDAVAVDIRIAGGGRDPSAGSTWRRSRPRR